jgi:hypothetical protein
MRTVAIICSAIVGISFLSLPAVAQQKTVKACQEEWRANKDANQAKGITEKAYVTQCRAAGAAAPASAPAASSAQKTAAPAGDQKTAKACRDEWRANKDANQAKGITEKAYIAQCRTGGTVAAPMAPMAPPPAPAPAKPMAAPAAPPASTMAKPAPTAQTTPTGANQYATETQAKIRCLSGTVVWANLNSKIYHFAGNKDYGNTKSGAYMCETDATGQGIRAAKNEKHP